VTVSSLGKAGLNALFAMNKISKTPTHFAWQFRLANISTAPHGVQFLGARAHSRGPWIRPPVLPAYVADWLCLQPASGDTFVVEGYTSVDELRSANADSGSNKVRWQSAPAGELKGVVALQPPATTSRASKFGLFPSFAHGDGAKWGISDFYEEKERALRAALAGGRDFSTGWYSSKKEIASGCVSRFGGLIRCEASVSNDFDTEGSGSVNVVVGRKGPARLFDEIVAGLDRALELASADQKGNETVALWSVHDRKGRWIESYLAPCGFAPDFGAEESPPGDYYHKWGWQDEGKVPAKVRSAFEKFLGRRAPDGKRTFKTGGFRFSMGDD